MVEFFQTGMGHKYYDGTMPRIAAALEGLLARWREPEACEYCCVDVARLVNATLARLPAEGRPGEYVTGAYVAKDWDTDAIRALFADGWRWVRTDGPWAVLERRVR